MITKTNQQTKMINKEEKCVLKTYNVIKFLYQTKDHHVGNIPTHTYANKQTHSLHND